METAGKFVEGGREVCLKKFCFQLTGGNAIMRLKLHGNYF